MGNNQRISKFAFAIFIALFFTLPLLFCNSKPLSSSPHVVIFGASAIDFIGHSPTPYTPGGCSSGRVNVRMGGVGRNLAEMMRNLSEIILPDELKLEVDLVSPLSHDSTGELIIADSKRKGIDMSNTVFLDDSSSPSCLYLMTMDGEVSQSVCDFRIVRKELQTSHYYHNSSNYTKPQSSPFVPGVLSPKFDRLFKTASLIVIEGNNPSYLTHFFMSAANAYKKPLLFAPTTYEGFEDTLRTSLKTDIGSAPTALHLNEHELYTMVHDEIPTIPPTSIVHNTTSIHESLNVLFSRGTEIAVVTSGNIGMCIAARHSNSSSSQSDPNNIIFECLPSIPVTVHDVIGAGDSATSAFIVKLVETGLIQTKSSRKVELANSQTNSDDDSSTQTRLSPSFYALTREEKRTLLLSILETELAVAASKVEGHSLTLQHIEEMRRRQSKNS
ncbi:putative pfkB family carbohydrate kinase [Blattamonas nauphoetae]|uniref:PfkB family carbohydrate kinase n=1 Tax=Blattamonas nauphoetae TaxID=2049346 RepID=A0ABQ9XT26_9EUKA|nr:putative pfkB family carbohydrate kinase [Blattamonas nauphoetae]